MKEEPKQGSEVSLPEDSPIQWHPAFYAGIQIEESIVNIIMNANKDLFKEMDIMCEALMELMKDELEERERLGEQQGEDRVNQLIEKLISLNRMDDIVKSVSDRLYQKQLFAEFHL